VTFVFKAKILIRLQGQSEYVQLQNRFSHYRKLLGKLNELGRKIEKGRDFRALTGYLGRFLISVKCE